MDRLHDSIGAGGNQADLQNAILRYLPDSGNGERQISFGVKMKSAFRPMFTLPFIEAGHNGGGALVDYQFTKGWLFPDGFGTGVNQWTAELAGYRRAQY